MSLIKPYERPLRGLFLYIYFSLSILFSKGYNPKIIKIEVDGNNKTLDYVINREIKHESETILDSSKAEQDRNRIENLGIFSQVTWKAVPLEDGTAILEFNVIESIQRTPPLAIPTYEEETGWSLTGFWLLNNFKGKNQVLTLGGSIGGKDTYGLQFSDPWIFGNHVSMNFQFGKTLFQHRFLDMNLEVNSIYFSFGKWFGENFKTALSLEIEEKIFLNDSKSQFLYFSPSLSMKFDTRDIYWNPGRGFLITHYLDRITGLNPKAFWLAHWNQSLSTFYSLYLFQIKNVLAFNFSSSLKWGKKSEIWLDYFGGSNSVRGWAIPDSTIYYNASEPFRFGHESLHFSFETRNELIPKYATSIGVEFGLVLVFFGDVGVVVSKIDDINDQLPIVGSGLGLRIPFPIVDVLRFDYGWGYHDGKWNTGTFHFGIGQKF